MVSKTNQMDAGIEATKRRKLETIFNNKYEKMILEVKKCKMVHTKKKFFFRVKSISIRIQ